MPLWTIYHPPSTFTTADSRAALSTDITKIYTSIGLPAFYVIINFIPLPTTQTYIGGILSTSPRSHPHPHTNSHPHTNPHSPTTILPSDAAPRPFIRIVITQIAVRVPNEDSAYEQVTTGIDRALKPHVSDRGYDWEYHVEETERRLWKINGLIPPAWRSEEERRWREVNAPLVWEGAYPASASASASVSVSGAGTGL